MAATDASGHAAAPQGEGVRAGFDAQARQRHARLYLLFVLLIPLLMVASAFWIVPSRWLEMRSGNMYLANLGYATKLYGRSCQVLIYGDSGAMVGVDPAIVHQRTGLTVCNIAEFQGMTLVNQTLPLDLFLRHNPAPRYLIFLYAPENLSVPFSWSKYATFEAISFRIEQQPTLRTALLLAQHPSETMGWVEGGLRLALTRVFSQPFPAVAARARERHDGQLKVPGARNRTQCDDSVPPVAPDAGWIEHLRTAYANSGTTVLVDAIPTASCDRNNNFNDEHLRGIVDNYPLAHFPVYAYTEEGLLHTNEYGARLLSNLIADQLQQRMEHPPSAGAR